MVIKIKVKNADKYVLLDHEVFEALSALTLFQEYHVLDHLREHSSGVPVFQKYINNTPDGKLKVDTIYLAHFIAKKYIPHPESEKRMFLHFLNGDKLDLRLRNLKWESMDKVKRSPRTKSESASKKRNGKTKKTTAGNQEKKNKDTNVNASPVEIDKVALLPAHFEPLRKKRVPKEERSGHVLQFENKSNGDSNNISQQQEQSTEEFIPHVSHG